MLDIFPSRHLDTCQRLLLEGAPIQEILACLEEMAAHSLPGHHCSIQLHDLSSPSPPGQPEQDGTHPVRSWTGETIGSIRLTPPPAAIETLRPILKAVGQLASLAYDRHQLSVELMDRTRLAAVAVRISDILGRTLPLPSMLQQCTEALVDVLDMAFARIWLLDDTQQVLILTASAGLSTNLHGAYSRVPVGTSLKIGRMVHDRQPRLTNHIRREPWIKEPEWAEREGLVAYAGYPLIAEDHVVGVIAMFARHRLPEHTLQTLGAIAGGLAQAIIRNQAEAHRRFSHRLLGERVKEIHALHQTASLLQSPGPVPELLQRMVSNIPAAWRYPEVTAARIQFGGCDYQTPDFRNSPWHQAADFWLSNGQAGRLEVVYLDERPTAAEGPFLFEERRLLDSLAEMLRNYLERKQTEQALWESRESLRRLNLTLEEQVRERTRQLLGKQDQLRLLAVELSRTEERERRQLATDLHDNLAQLLALARMKLHAAQPQWTGKAFDELKGLLDESLTYVRGVMSDLRPPLLSDAHDLQRAISWVVERLERRGLQVTVEHDGQPIVLDDEVLGVTYRAVHELLFNVLKHAQTREATLTLRRFDGGLEVVVRDRGVGFTLNERRSASNEGGFGLLNIRERLELLGARVQIMSRPGEGTCATVIVPRLDTFPARSPVTADNPIFPDRDRLHDGLQAVDGVRTRIVLVDDHQMVRQGLRSIIEGHPTLDVVAEVSDGQMAVQVARQLHPDVVLMDINLPKMNGLEATRLITAEFPDMTVIGLSMHDDPKMAQAMRAAGATGYVSKGEAVERLVDVIEEARLKHARR